MTEAWAILKDSSPKSPASLRHRPYNLGRAPIGTQVDDGITTQIAWALEFGQPARPFNGIGSRVRGETASSQMAMIDELLGLLGRIGDRRQHLFFGRAHSRHENLCLVFPH